MLRPRLPRTRAWNMRATWFAPAVALVTISLACTTTLVAAEAFSPDSDMGRLQGRWTARAGAKREVRVIMAVVGRQVNVSIATPQGIRFKVRGEIQVDESTSPRQLDWIKFTGADQQVFPQISAIYKIDRDTFIVCNGGLNGTRPKEFKPGDGILADVVEFQRAVEPAAKSDKLTSQDAGASTK